MDSHQLDAAGSETILTSQEETQLKRVYTLLCDLHEKSRLLQEIEEKKHALKTNEANKIDEGLQLAIAKRVTGEVELLQEQLRSIESKDDKRISPHDVAEALRVLGKKTSKKEILETVWEVDENLDGFIDWSEFCLMFSRNIVDTSGLEPSKMYHLVQFMIFDQNENGLVSVDETMGMLYERYGRQRMEGKLREIFGSNMQETGKQGGEINFRQYLEAVERIQYETFSQTSLGKLSRRKGKDGT